MKILHLIAFLFALNLIASSQNNVYLILGSDTAIWDAMSVNKFNCTYNYNVIPDNTRNFYKSMQSSFRSKFSDSYGNKLKLTWWLMGGNIFRYATNKNVPIPNLIVLYQTKKFYGNQFQEYGDELSLHYHTFIWTDYDNDGIYWWNQAMNFNECADDFYFTLCQYLLEEDIFPVSFRSGWNYMSNEWQSHLDKILMFSMHNEAPAYHNDTEEPLDNIYDWRLASQEFVPYKPSPQNYQLPGGNKGYNLHSKYIGNLTQNQMNDIFKKAKNGVDQVVCLWGHIWDDYFLEYCLRIDTLAHNSALLYPSVKFKYTTAIEGMQLWLKTSDNTPPSINVQEIQSGDKIKFSITSNETIFQEQPFFAIKDINENYFKAECIQTGVNQWISKSEFNKKDLAKIGVAVTDTFGNLSKKIIKYKQDDVFIDNNDDGYNEICGIWNTSSKAAWGFDSRYSKLRDNDSSKIRWNFQIEKSSDYSIFYQIPKSDSLANNILFRFFRNNSLIDTILFTSAPIQEDWLHLNILTCNAGDNLSIEMIAYGKNQVNKLLFADVLKISPLVRPKAIYFSPQLVNLGEVVKKDTIYFDIVFTNKGSENLIIHNIISKQNYVTTQDPFPIVIPKLKNLKIKFSFFSADSGTVKDTLLIFSEDTLTANKIIVNATMRNFFKIIDNEDSLNYKETSGQWNYSVAQAFGNTSRYAYLNQSPKASAYFTGKVPENNFYNISFIVPKTINSTDKALYIIEQENLFKDSIYIDQNQNSGNWVNLGNYFLSSAVPFFVRVIDNGGSTTGPVIRTDAIKVALSELPSSNRESDLNKFVFKLEQNYPNPFNSSTIIQYEIPLSFATSKSDIEIVSLTIYDILGRKLETLVNERKTPGRYSIEWNANNYSSGIYYYELKAGNFRSIKKMVLIK